MGPYNVAILLKEAILGDDNISQSFSSQHFCIMPNVAGKLEICNFR
jgi:hypothetical protein